MQTIEWDGPDTKAKRDAYKTADKGGRSWYFLSLVSELFLINKNQTI